MKHHQSHDSQLQIAQCFMCFKGLASQRKGQMLFKLSHKTFIGMEDYQNNLITRAKSGIMKSQAEILSKVNKYLSFSVGNKITR